MERGGAAHRRPAGGRVRPGAPAPVGGGPARVGPAVGGPAAGGERLMPAKRGFQADDFWSVRLTAAPQVSPDGTRVAYVVSTNDQESDKPQTTIWVAPTDGSS